MESRIAEYTKFNWYVVPSKTPVLLGDTVCVFEVSGERRFKPVDEAADAVHRIYFPISANRVLVGTPFKRHPTIDVRILNKAVVRCSYEFFVSSTRLQESTLEASLGKWSGIIAQDEIEKILADLKRDAVKASS